MHIKVLICCVRLPLHFQILLLLFFFSIFRVTIKFHANIFIRLDQSAEQHWMHQGLAGVLHVVVIR